MFKCTFPLTFYLVLVATYKQLYTYLGGQGRDTWLLEGMQRAQVETESHTAMGYRQEKQAHEQASILGANNNTYTLAVTTGHPFQCYLSCGLDNELLLPNKRHVIHHRIINMVWVRFTTTSDKQ